MTNPTNLDKAVSLPLQNSTPFSGMRKRDLAVKIVDEGIRSLVAPYYRMNLEKVVDGQLVSFSITHSELANNLSQIFINKLIHRKPPAIETAAPSPVEEPAAKEQSPLEHLMPLLTDSSPTLQKVSQEASDDVFYGFHSAPIIGVTEKPLQKTLTDAEMALYWASLAPEVATSPVAAKASDEEAARAFAYWASSEAPTQPQAAVKQTDDDLSWLALLP